MRKNHLTKKQERVLIHIRNYLRDNGQSPKISDLRAMMHVKSLRTVTQYLEIIERKGFISRDKYSKRNIRLLNRIEDINSRMINFPIFGSAGCDNQTILAEPIHDEYIAVSKDYLGDRVDKLKAIKALGDSMMDAGVNNGDVVLIEENTQVKNGERVVAVIDDIVVLKRISFTESAVVLSPVSKDPNYKPIIMKKDFKPFGRVIDVIPKHNSDESQYIPIKDD